MTAKLLLTILKLALTCVLIVPGIARAQSPSPSSGKKPNILVIWGDDIGYWNVSAYNQGMMGYKTSNIDRLAKEGALFTDWYGQQSCTAAQGWLARGERGLASA
jgi:arylsulfatase